MLRIVSLLSLCISDVRGVEWMRQRHTGAAASTWPYRRRRLVVGRPDESVALWRRHRGNDRSWCEPTHRIDFVADGDQRLRRGGNIGTTSVYAVSAKDGRTLWTRPGPNIVIGLYVASYHSSKAKGGIDVLVLWDESNGIWAFNASTTGAAAGQVLWKNESTTANVITPVFYDDATLICDGESFHLLDTATGMSRWRVPVVDPVEVPTSGGNLYATIAAAEKDPSVASAVAIVGMVSASGYAPNNLRGVDMATGNVLWHYTEPNTSSYVLNTALANGGVLILIKSPLGGSYSVPNVIWAVNIRTGATLWNKTAIAPEGYVNVVSFTATCVILTWTEVNHTHVASWRLADGRQVWDYRQSYEVTVSTPGVVNKDVIYVNTNAPSILALDAVTGRRRWNYTSQAPCTVPEVFGSFTTKTGKENAVVLAVCEDDYLYAFEEFNVPGGQQHAVADGDDYAE